MGKHTLKGLRYDKSGNPLYTSDTMSDDDKKNQGWKFSKKHGMYGQLSDPTKLSESSTDINEAISTDYRSTLKLLFAKSFGNLNDNEKQYLYDLLNNEPWETIYVALEMLKPYNPNNKVNEGKDIISMDSIYNQVLERIVDFLERGDMEIKFGNMNGQSFDVYLPLSEKYLEISYMGKTIKMPLNKRVEDLSDESIARSIMNGFSKLYGN